MAARMQGRVDAGIRGGEPGKGCAPLTSPAVPDSGGQWGGGLPAVRHWGSKPRRDPERARERAAGLISEAIFRSALLALWQFQVSSVAF